MSMFHTCFANFTNNSTDAHEFICAYSWHYSCLFAFSFFLSNFLRLFFLHLRNLFFRLCLFLHFGCISLHQSQRRKLGNKDSNAFLEGLHGSYTAIGHDFQSDLVIIGPLADAHVLDLVIHTAQRIAQSRSISRVTPENLELAIIFPKSRVPRRLRGSDCLHTRRVVSDELSDLV